MRKYRYKKSDNGNYNSIVCETSSVKRIAELLKDELDNFSGDSRLSSLEFEISFSDGAELVFDEVEDFFEQVKKRLNDISAIDFDLRLIDDKSIQVQLSERGLDYRVACNNPAKLSYFADQIEQEFGNQNSNRFLYSVATPGIIFFFSMVASVVVPRQVAAYFSWDLELASLLVAPFFISFIVGSIFLAIKFYPKFVLVDSDTNKKSARLFGRDGLWLLGTIFVGLFISWFYEILQQARP